MRRITPEIVEKIEALITCAEESGHRAATIKFNLRDLVVVSRFLSVLRSLGMDIPKRNGFGMNPQDRKDFIEFLRAKKAAAEQRQ